MAGIARRTVLQGLTLAFLAPRLARAQSIAPAAKRLIIFFSPNGTIHSKWRPTGSGTTFSFPAGSILEPLAALKDDLIILDGIDFYDTNNHEAGMAAMLTGNGGASTRTRGMSVDQYVAARIGVDTRFLSLELGVQTSAWGGSVQTRMSYASAGRYVPPDDDPASCHRRIFGEPAGTEGASKLLTRRKSVLDLIRKELGTLSARVGPEERAKLGVHLDALRQVETSLSGANTGTETCTASNAPMIDGRANDNFPIVGRQQTDLLISALACGVTRVASLQWSHTVSPTVFTWEGQSEAHHALSHMADGNTAGVAGFVAVERWFATQFAYLVDRLKTLPEPGGDGTMLDHTAIVWAKELGDSRLHDCRSVPFVLAGRAGGAWSTGKYLRLGGAPHQHLLVSICRAIGLDDDTFGDPTHGTGPLAGL